MFEYLSPTDRTIAIQRLTALWAFNECGLGGVLHAIQSPFTGLIVGSIAMICIALICMLAENKWASVMTALTLVLIIKAMVSPHSTPTAYVAVSFQAVTGAIIYRYVPHLVVASIFFMTLGHIESACQRILTLTILYGNSLWESIDIWGEVVTSKWNVMLPFSSSRLIILIYLTIHLIAGIIIGYLVFRLIKSIHAHWGESQFRLILGQRDKKYFLSQHGNKKKWKRYVMLVVIMLLIIPAYMIRGNGDDMQQGLISVLRAIIIMFIWFVFAGPFLMKLMHRFLKRKQSVLAEQVSHTMDMMPHLAWIIEKAWNETTQLNGATRIKTFIIRSLLYILQYKISDDPYTDRADTRS